MKKYKNITQETITQDQFNEFTRPIINLPINLVWRGFGSAIILEIGDLTERTVYSKKSNKSRVITEGQFGVVVEWSWRVERPKSIYFGSWSTDRIIDYRLTKLQQRTIKSIGVGGRLPELIIEMSDGLWLHTFATRESQPRWFLALDRKQQPRKTLVSENGKLILQTWLY